MTTPASAAQEALDLLAQTEHGGLCGCGYRESLHKVSGQGGAYCELAKARHLLRLVEENQQLLDSIDMFHKNVYDEEGVTSEPELRAFHAELLAIVQRDQSDADCVTAVGDALDRISVIWLDAARSK